MGMRSSKRETRALLERIMKSIVSVSSFGSTHPLSSRFAIAFFLAASSVVVGCGGSDGNVTPGPHENGDDGGAHHDDGGARPDGSAPPADGGAHHDDGGITPPNDGGI